MKFAIARIAALVLALGSTHIARGATTGSSTVSPFLKLGGLVKLCERDDATSRAACGAYISGFVAGSQATQTSVTVKLVADRVIKGTVAPHDEAINAAAARLNNELNVFCIGTEWTAGYVGAVVVQYGLEHQDQLNDKTSDHMLQILAKAFPCLQRPVK
jgi:hypothetical protein